MRSDPATWTNRILPVVLVLVLALIAAFQGVLTDKEALKYMGCAQDVLHGDVTDLLGNYKGFAAYVLFLLPFTAIGAPWLAVVAQAVLMLFALRALGRIAERITGSPWSAVFAMGAGALCLPWQQWTMALYTECFFSCVLVLFFERITRNGRTGMLDLVLAALVVFARPVGLLFAGPALLWKLDASGLLSLNRWVLFAGGLCVLLVAVLLPGIPRAQITPIVEGHVICGFPERVHAMDHFEGSSILDAQVAVVSEEGIGYSGQLFLRRVASLFTFPRSYYSVPHNLFVSAHYALVVLAGIGWWRYRQRPIAWMMSVATLLYVCLIGLTHDEWSGRFFVPLWPILIVFAACALRNERTSVTASS